MVQRRSPEEIKRSIEVAKTVMEERKRKDGVRDIRRARGTLIFLGCLQAAVAVYEGYGPLNSQLAMIIDLVIAGIFFGCYFLSRQYPLAAFLIALIVYVGVHLFVVLITGDPINLISGIIWKVVIIAFLGTGLNAARKYHQPKSEVRDDLLDDHLEID